ncbi:MAG: tetratricopeptide repeat protein [Pseudomonadota bacterium]
MYKLIYAVLLGVLLTATAGAVEVDSLVEAGNKLWSEGSLEQAESTFREAIKLDPGAALPHARLAGLLLNQHRNDEARTEYQNAIINDPEDPALFLALAIVYLHEKSYSEAQAMVDVALELAPEQENALKLQQYVVAKMSRLEEVKNMRAEHEAKKK